DEAGVQAGDVITKVGDYELNAQTTFSEALFNYKPGDKVVLEINRGGKSITVTITLGERPANINQ
ncbi:MAG TPA: PDZ domain-containing protein, partial [Thermomicrobiales bacterium]|nr:PDZ domain-containing protein [Thermomicrobiales bacterium]